MNKIFNHIQIFNANRQQLCFNRVDEVFLGMYLLPFYRFYKFLFFFKFSTLFLLNLLPSQCSQHLQFKIVNIILILEKRSFVIWPNFVQFDTVCSYFPVSFYSNFSPINIDFEVSLGSFAIRELSYTLFISICSTTMTVNIKHIVMYPLHIYNIETQPSAWSLLHHNRIVVQTLKV